MKMKSTEDAILALRYAAKRLEDHALLTPEADISDAYMCAVRFLVREAETLEHMLWPHHVEFPPDSEVKAAAVAQG